MYSFVKYLSKNIQKLIKKRTKLYEIYIWMFKIYIILIICVYMIMYDVRIFMVGTFVFRKTDFECVISLSQIFSM